MATLKQRVEMLEATALDAGVSMPTEIWLAAPGGECAPVLLWRSPAVQASAGVES